MTEKTERLIQLIAEHDDQLAFKELYKHYFPGLLSFAHSVMNDRQHLEEVIHDVFINLWENRKTLPAVKNLSNYLYVAVKHACISFLRKRKIIYSDHIEDHFLYTFATPENNLISREIMNTINSAIQDLPERCRLVFRLIKEERLKYEEVSQLLNLSIKTIEAQMTIANKKLVVALKPYLFESKATKKVKK